MSISLTLALYILFLWDNLENFSKLQRAQNPLARADIWDRQQQG